MSQQPDPEGLIEEMRSRQTNIVFPDTVRNYRHFLVFLFHGAPHPTKVQKVAASIFGLFFASQSIFFLAISKTYDESVSASDGDRWWMRIVSFLLMMLAIRVLRNAFPRPSNDR